MRNLYSRDEGRRGSAASINLPVNPLHAKYKEHSINHRYCCECTSLTENKGSKAFPTQNPKYSSAKNWASFSWLEDILFLDFLTNYLLFLFNYRAMDMMTECKPICNQVKHVLASKYWNKYLSWSFLFDTHGGALALPTSNVERVRAGHYIDGRLLQVQRVEARGWGAPCPILCLDPQRDQHARKGRSLLHKESYITITVDDIRQYKR